MPIEDRLTDVPGLAASTRYSHAVVASGRLAFVSGQISVDDEGKVVGVDDLAAQTRQVLTNLHHVITELGAGWGDVVKLGWYVLDASEVQTIRDIRRELMGDHTPASTLVEVSALVQPEFLVEVDAVVALT
ncbi:hypothetical protein Lesp02_58050 [Lentzea sp. NBRC 105346]|uniref:RidA family protein n=1 Tax=Lentzea sp. NBRC 105346 TaxID=3032205 RepID=UPI0024A130AE|nr:RidA family protein [Lentzea sp. NBRC 105346]GLZ33617.1 hypothetical protein Lesp02_58050 [Lentzea sp. NBRC 105346]